MGTRSSSSAVPEESTSHDWLWETARTMNTEMFTALWLKYKQDMPVAEIAQVMKKSQTAVRVLLHPARKRLADEITESSESRTEQANWNISRIGCFERTQ